MRNGATDLVQRQTFFIITYLPSCWRIAAIHGWIMQSNFGDEHTRGSKALVEDWCLGHSDQLQMRFVTISMQMPLSTQVDTKSLLPTMWALPPQFGMLFYFIEPNNGNEWSKLLSGVWGILLGFGRRANCG